MRNQVRKYILGFSLVVALSMTVPAMAETSDGNGDDSFLTRLKNIIVGILDVDYSKISLPPG